MGMQGQPWLMKLDSLYYMRLSKYKSNEATTMKLSFELVVLVWVWVALRHKLYILIRGGVQLAFVLRYVP